jgi:hypothetical protein
VIIYIYIYIYMGATCPGEDHCVFLLGEWDINVRNGCHIYIYI